MLVYTSDAEPGIRRVGAGKGFFYRDPDGEKVSSPDILARINGLAIPPAYRDVWICTVENGHLQATGRDGKERKQYRYHPDWSEIRNQKKFDQLQSIGEKLPRLRRRLRRDLSDFAGEKHQVVAAAVKLIDRLGYRVGNETYLLQNGTRGISTLSVDNIDIDDESGEISLHYCAKGGKEIEEEFTDRRLSEVLSQCQDLPGQRLFTYRTSRGDTSMIRSTDVNSYLQEVLGEGVTAKDLRTWRASAEAVNHLRKIETPSDREAELVEAMRYAADQINNRYETCREYYVHPAVSEFYRESGKSGIFDLRPKHIGRLRKAELLLLHILRAAC